VWRLFDLTPDGRRDANIKIDPPSDVQIRLVSAERGSEVEVRRCTWRARRPLDDGRGLDAVFDESTKAYRFRTVAGDIDVDVCGEPEFGFASRVLQIQPGPNAFTIPLERGCGVSLSLHDGPSVIAWPQHLEPIVEPIGGAGRALGSSGEGTTRHVSVSSPGRYRITMPPIDGYHPVPPFEIELAKEAFLDREIPLRRED
jgi:hypothetical protein